MNMKPQPKTPDGRTIISGHRTGQKIYAKNVHFDDCILDDCLIVYSGENVSWGDFEIKNCKVQFAGAASLTLSFLQKFCDVDSLHLDTKPKDLKNLPLISDGVH